MTTTPLIVSTESEYPTLPSVVEAYFSSLGEPSRSIVDGLVVGLRQPHSSLEVFLIKVTAAEWEDIVVWGNALTEVTVPFRVFFDMSVMTLKTDENTRGEYLIVVSSPLFTSMDVADEWDSTNKFDVAIPSFTTS